MDYVFNALSWNKLNSDFETSSYQTKLFANSFEKNHKTLPK